ncbi:kinase-like domain-containing protein [Bombardia bombarda]|uniref:non-specific serine/threonine protein kinase n=1 Tax=Bombardia bombarda TaxID=252184 RepID=A0AA39XBC0_9PEZI|nr:kinase-like domain-containing protein [Bombardia bombarda]
MNFTPTSPHEVDPDIIAWLCPVSQKARQATLSLANRRCFRTITQDSNSQRSTPEWIDCWDGVALQNNCSFCLVLTFSQIPSNEYGFVLGSDRETCDILLPGYNISRNHCFIGFTRDRALAIQDRSTNGTRVSYDDSYSHQAWYTTHTWRLSGQHLDDCSKTIDMQDYVFDISVNTAAAHNYQFHVSLTSYLSWHRPLEHQTIQTPIYTLGKTLGSGAYGFVCMSCEAGSGTIYAIKTTKNPGDRSVKREYCCLKEIQQLKKQSNMPGKNYIIKLVDVIKCATSRLVLEYFPLGSLHDQAKARPLSNFDQEMLLHSGLQALDFLHSHTMMHRDIKPQNILVRSREPMDIVLADFGACSRAGYAHSFYGSYLYAAPEVAQAYSDLLDGSRVVHRYDSRCDIWSFGVSVLQYTTAGIPMCPFSHRLSSMTPDDWCEKRLDQTGERSLPSLGEMWCKSVASHARAHAYEGSRITRLSQLMLVEDPLQRRAASECLQIMYGDEGAVSWH